MSTSGVKPIAIAAVAISIVATITLFTLGVMPALAVLGAALVGFAVGWLIGRVAFALVDRAEARGGR